MVQKTAAVKEAAPVVEEKKSNNTFLDFYNPQTKVKKVFTLDVSKLDKVILRQEYNRDEDRHTVVLELPDKSICFCPRLDKLGKIATYVRRGGVEVVEEL